MGKAVQVIGHQTYAIHARQMDLPRVSLGDHPKESTAQYDYAHLGMRKQRPREGTDAPKVTLQLRAKTQWPADWPRIRGEEKGAGVR